MYYFIVFYSFFITKFVIICMNRGSEKMKKKILSLLVVGVMALNLTGCAMFESEINDIKGNLV